MDYAKKNLFALLLIIAPVITYGDSLSGVWEGYLVLGGDKIISKPLYLSVHDKNDILVVSMLSTIEKNMTFLQQPS